MTGRGIWKLPMIVAIVFMLTAILSVNTYAATPLSDIGNHWAKEQVSYLTEKGIISGYPDNTFKPQNNVTRAEFYRIINGVIGYTELAEINYTDVRKGEWYYNEIAKGVKAGYIFEKSGGKIEPDKAITRQEVARIISVTFGLVENAKAAEKFADAGQIADWAKGHIGALQGKKFILGYPDNTFKPQGLITRAEAATMIKNASGEIVNQKGQYKHEVKGNLLVNTKDVTLKDTVIKGDLYLAEGIADGDVTLDNVTVEGETFVRGGGENSIVFKNSRLQNVFSNKSAGKVRIVFEGKVTVLKIDIQNDTVLVLRDGVTVASIAINGQADIQMQKGAVVQAIEANFPGAVIDSQGTIEIIKALETLKLNGNNVAKGSETKVTNGAAPRPATGSSGGGGGGGGSSTPISAAPDVTKIKVQYFDGDMYHYKFIKYALKEGTKISVYASASGSELLHPHVLRQDQTGSGDFGTLTKHKEVQSAKVFISITEPGKRESSRVGVDVEGYPLKEEQTSIGKYDVKIRKIGNEYRITTVGNWDKESDRGTPYLLLAHLYDQEAKMSTLTKLSADGKSMDFTLDTATDIKNGRFWIIELGYKISDYQSFTVEEGSSVDRAVESLKPLTVINVVYGTPQEEINLPDKVTLVLDDESEVEADVTWDQGESEYNGYKAGTYTFTGTITLPENVTNPKNLKATVNVVVLAPGELVNVEGIVINEAAQELEVGATLPLTTTITPANATNQDVTWTTSDDTVATVSESGLVVAVAKGEATITVTTVDGNKTANVVITVVGDAEEPEGMLALVQEGTTIKARWEGFNHSYYGFRILDSEDKVQEYGIVQDGSKNETNNLALYLPRLESGEGTYSFVLYAMNSNSDGSRSWGSQLARLDNAIKVTVSGEPVAYNMEYNVEYKDQSDWHRITWENNEKPNGIWQIQAWYDDSNAVRRGSGSISDSIMENKPINVGDIFDLRIVTNYTLDNQTLKATITPPSTKKYALEVVDGELVGATEYSGYDNWKEAITTEGIDFRNITQAQAIKMGIATPDNYGIALALKIGDDIVELNSENLAKVERVKPDGTVESPLVTDSGTVQFVHDGWGDIGEYAMRYTLKDGRIIEAKINVVSFELKDEASSVAITAADITGDVVGEVTKDGLATYLNEMFTFTGTGTILWSDNMLKVEGYTVAHDKDSEPAEGSGAWSIWTGRIMDGYNLDLSGVTAFSLTSDSWLHIQSAATLTLPDANKMTLNNGIITQDGTDTDTAWGYKSNGEPKYFKVIKGTLPEYSYEEGVTGYPDPIEIGKRMSNAETAFKNLGVSENKIEGVTWRELTTAVHYFNVAKDTVGIDSTKLGNLDSQFRAIKKLNMSGKELTSLETDMTEPASATGVLVPFTGLEELNISGTGVTNIGGLVGLAEIKNLDISDNKFTDENANNLAALAKMLDLVELNISKTSITDLNILVDEENETRFTELTNLQATNLELTSIFGLTHVAGKELPEGVITWNLGGSTLTNDGDNANHLSILNTRATEKSIIFTAPTIILEAPSDGLTELDKLDGVTAEGAKFLVYGLNTEDNGGPEYGPQKPSTLSEIKNFIDGTYAVTFNSENIVVTDGKIEITGNVLSTADWNKVKAAGGIPGTAYRITLVKDTATTNGNKGVPAEDKVAKIAIYEDGVAVIETM